MIDGIVGFGLCYFVSWVLCWLWVYWLVVLGGLCAIAFWVSDCGLVGLRVSGFELQGCTGVLSFARFVGFLWVGIIRVFCVLV